MNKQHKTNSVESPLQHIETANKFLPRFFSGQAETMALNIPFFPIAGIDGDFSNQPYLFLQRRGSSQNILHQ